MIEALLILYLFFGALIAGFLAFIGWDTAATKEDAPKWYGLVFVLFFWPLVAIALALVMVWERLRLGGGE